MNCILKGRITRAVSGGTTVGLDETLTIQGMAADAKATGDAIRASVTEVTKEVTEVVTKEIETVVEKEVQVQIQELPSDDSLAHEALETAQAAKTIAESTQEYVDSLSIVQTVNGVAADEFGNVNVEVSETVLKEVIEESTEVKEVIVEEVLANVPAATSANIAKATDGTVTITTPMDDGTTSVCVLTPGADGFPVMATIDGNSVPITWEGW